MNAVTQIPALEDHQQLVNIAREIAMNIKPLSEILTDAAIDMAHWALIKDHPRFVSVLKSEIEAWAAAENTESRVKLKAAAMIEGALPSFYKAMVDDKEALKERVDAAKMVAALAGMGGRVGVNANDVNDTRFSVTINIGAEKMTFDKSKVIDHVE